MRTIALRPAGTPAFLFAWVRRRQEDMSDVVHAVGDERARDHCWDVIKGRGRLGFGSRSYRDPRFGDQGRIRAEAKILRAPERLRAPRDDPRPTRDLIVGEKAGDCRARRAGE